MPAISVGYALASDVGTRFEGSSDFGGFERGMWDFLQKVEAEFASIPHTSKLNEFMNSVDVMNEGVFDHVWQVRASWLLGFGFWALI